MATSSIVSTKTNSCSRFFAATAVRQEAHAWDTGVLVDAKTIFFDVHRLP
jgi:hypothetical protein